jgi:hypothetical protein
MAMQGRAMAMSDMATPVAASRKSNITLTVRASALLNP